MHLQGLERLMTQGGYDMVQKLFLDFFRRRLSQRPTAEELEQRNILKRKCLSPWQFLLFLWGLEL